MKKENSYLGIPVVVEEIGDDIYIIPLEPIREFLQYRPVPFDFKGPPVLDMPQIDFGRQAGIIIMSGNGA